MTQSVLIEEECAMPKWKLENFVEEDAEAGFTLSALGNAISTYIALRDEGKKSVKEISDLFNVEPPAVTKAAEDHHWLYISGRSDDFAKVFIENDGA